MVKNRPESPSWEINLDCSKLSIFISEIVSNFPIPIRITIYSDNAESFCKYFRPNPNIISIRNGGLFSRSKCAEIRVESRDSLDRILEILREVDWKVASWPHLIITDSRQSVLFESYDFATSVFVPQDILTESLLFSLLNEETINGFDAIE